MINLDNAHITVELKPQKRRSLLDVVDQENGWQISETAKAKGKQEQQTPSIVHRRVSSRGTTNGVRRSILLQEKVKQVQPKLANNFMVEKEDDMGQQQQASGGFGDSQQLDEDTIQQLIHMQNNQKQKTNQNKWEEETISEDYIMESTVFDYEEVRKSEHFGIKKYSDAIYRGELKNGKRNGMGVMLYKKSRVYEGYWLNDVRHGKGYERYSNGNKYEGDFLNGKAHGKGVYLWANGEVYDGEWKIGVKEGYGIWKGIFGDSYIGEWKNSKADGYGVHQWKNGDRYEGEWVNCLKHGQGTDIFANGDSYTGQYKHGKPDGHGQYKWQNGSLYIGDFKDGQKHGKGKWKKLQNSQTCNTYEGQYQFDKKNGYGIFTWESGNVYKGNYKNDERDGYGEMYWIDGSQYIGQWKKGIQHGLGKMIFPDGTVKEGKFENNVFVGENQSDKKDASSDFANKLLMNSPPQSPNDSQKDQSSNMQKMQIRSVSRGRIEKVLRQQSNASVISMLTQIQKAPEKLNPVKIHSKKDYNSSSEYEINNEGYSSQGQESDSTRISNLLSKMSKPKPNTNREILIKKILSKPPKPKQTNQQNSSLNNSACVGYHSNNDSAFLPEIKRLMSKSSHRTQKTKSTDQQSGVRRVSPEAMALMMNNLKNNKQQKHWVPNGTQSKPEGGNSRVKKIVF